MIYSLSHINQRALETSFPFLFKEIKDSFRKEPSGSLLNCFLAFLCVILIFLSANHPLTTHPESVRRNDEAISSIKLPHPKFTLSKIEKHTIKPVDTKALMINKLAEEASKNSSSSYPEVKENIAGIVESLDKKQIGTPRVIAYAVATAERETGNTFKPIEEYDGPQQAITLGYSGGERFYGRGYIQITHDYNYEKYGQEIGMGEQLIQNPDLALQPKIASDILAEFFKDNGVAEKAEQDFVAAREPINGTDHADTIAYEAERYLQTIEQANTDALAYK